VSEQEAFNQGAAVEPEAGAAEQPADAESIATEETVESVRAQLEEARAENEQQMRGWQRTQADFANFRRRVEQEKDELTKYAEAGLVLDLLPVVDDLNRALDGLPADLRGLSWVQGILLIERKLRTVLEAHGVLPIEALGREFDPQVHEAVMREGETGEATTVTAEFQTGYTMGDRVLRPTLVKVGPPENSHNR
jgi:molecular chaperone GrpE